MGRPILNDDALEIRDSLVQDRVDGFPKKSGAIPSRHDDAEQGEPRMRSLVATESQRIIR